MLFQIPKTYNIVYEIFIETLLGTPPNEIIYYNYIIIFSMESLVFPWNHISKTVFGALQ